MSTSCDVVILPNEKLEQAAIRISQDLEQFNSLFGLRQAGQSKYRLNCAGQKIE
jgi:hypothetical protein